MSNVLEGIRLGLDLDDATPGIVYARLYGKALYQLEAMATGTNHKSAQECIRELRSIERAHGIHIAEMREEHESFPSEREWARGSDCD